MRAYSALCQESLRARDLLKDWFSEGFISEAQYQSVEKETVCELCRTNIFLRLALFFFTVIIVCAAVALFRVLFDMRTGMVGDGIFMLMVAAVAYAGAEVVVFETRLYRHGIEEALAACSVGFLCVGLQFALFSDHIYLAKPSGAEFLVPAMGAAASLWIWHRFGLLYAFPAAMIFVVWLPGHWTHSPSAQHLIVAGFYAAGLLTVFGVRRRYRFTYLDAEYSIAEALLWLGIYLAINLQLSSLNVVGHWWPSPRTAGDFSKAFYWISWALTWCLPALMLVRGLRRKDRFVIAVGALAVILTLATIQPYLGWQRHSWDLMLLGALMMGSAFFVRRWLADGPSQTRYGFTAQRLSGKDKSRMNAWLTASAFVSPNVIATSPQTRSSSDLHFGGGDFGGGGASSDF